jgi:hypothetical protein
MKKTLGATLMAIVLLVIFSGTSVLAQGPVPSPSVQVASNGEIGIDGFLGFLPRESPTNTALEGETWPTASVGWINIIRTGAGSNGLALSDKSLALKRVYSDPSWLITSTAFRSWNAVVETTKQFGNRHHLGFRVHSQKAGVTFRMQDISTQVQSYTLGATGYTADGVINASTNLSVLNNYRQRLEPGVDGKNGTNDDVISGTQSSSIASTSCLYGGLGVSIGAYGSGTDQQKLNNAANYCISNKLVLELTVTVPYLDNGTPKTLTGKKVFVPESFVQGSFMVDNSQEGVKPCILNGTHIVPLVDPDPEWLLIFQKSPTMGVQSWETVSAYFGRSGIQEEIEKDKLNNPRYFYRWIVIKPYPLTQNLRFARSIATEIPVQDSIAP